MNECNDETSSLCINSQCYLLPDGSPQCRCNDGFVKSDLANVCEPVDSCIGNDFCETESSVRKPYNPNLNV